MSVPIRPNLGDWFCFPQSVERMDRNAPSEKEHRWMVVETGFVSRFPRVMLRSTKPYGGIRHPAHDGACGAAGCRIDKPGWIRDQVRREIPEREFTSTRMSCREPDEVLIERVAQPMPSRHRRGSSRRGRR